MHFCEARIDFCQGCEKFGELEFFRAGECNRIIQYGVVSIIMLIVAWLVLFIPA